MPVQPSPMTPSVTHTDPIPATLAPAAIGLIRHPADGDPDVERALIDICTADIESHIESLDATISRLRRDIEAIRTISTQIGALGLLTAAERLRATTETGELTPLYNAIRDLKDQYDKVRSYLQFQRDASHTP